MTLISLQNGQLILQSGKVGTGQSCCCRGTVSGGGCCCKAGVISRSTPSKQACDLIGGDWLVGDGCHHFFQCSPECDRSGPGLSYCNGTECVAIDASATWCGLTVTPANSTDSILLPPFVCGETTYVDQSKYLEATFGVSYYCNCLTVTINAAAQITGVSGFKVFRATRTLCGASLTSGELVVTDFGTDVGICWPFCFSDPIQFSINFAP